MPTWEWRCLITFICPFVDRGSSVRPFLAMRVNLNTITDQNLERGDSWL